MAIEYVTIAPASDEHPRNDSATAVQLRDGSIFLVWMEFFASEWVSKDEAPNRLSSLRSTDGGRTWGAHQVEATTEPGDRSVYNPSLLRLANGEILFFYIRYHHLVWDDPLVVSGYLARSSDEAATWSQPVKLWDHDCYCGANATMVQLRDGRLIKPVERMPIWGRPDGASSSSCFISDDDGLSWREPTNWVRLPLRGTMEAHIAEAASGDLVMAVRNDLGAVFLSRSGDRGETWSRAQSTGLSAPESMVVLTAIPPTGDLLLIWNNSEYDPGFVSHYGKRTPLTAAVSRDGGLTWIGKKHIVEDPTLQLSNPSCMFTREGKALVSWFSSPMDDPEPPGVWGSNPWSLDAAVIDIDWFYR